MFDKRKTTVILWLERRDTMTKDNQLAVRITDEEKKEMLAMSKKLKFKSLSEFIIFLWDKFKSER